MIIAALAGSLLSNVPPMVGSRDRLLGTVAIVPSGDRGFPANPLNNDRQVDGGVKLQS
jgi:hypothetical protein